MDGLLLSPTLQDGEACQEFCKLAMDVASLPGGHRFSDDNECGLAELLAQAFGRTHTGHFCNWCKVTNNTLGRIASKKELLQFVKDVESAVVRHRLAQDHRMQNYLLACQILPEAVSLYLQSGLLPRIIQDTFWFHLNLLETLRTAQWEVESTTWKDGYIDQMVKYHSLELSQISQTVADYQTHLMETHVSLPPQRP